MRVSFDLPLDPDGVCGTLDDGTPFLFRPIRAEDRDAFVEAFERLSPRSRYLRFFSARDKLSPGLLAQLTDIDHDRHRAWVVSDPNAESTVPLAAGLGVAVGRLIDIEGEPGVAEAALIVTDDYQGKGFGGLLLWLLVNTARATGLHTVRFETLAVNRGMRALLRGFDVQRNEALSDRATVVYDLAVPSDSDDDPGLGALYELLVLLSKRPDGDDASGPSS